MFEVIYMKADFEPWWMFDGWEKEVLLRQSFQSQLDAEHYLKQLLSEFREKFENEQQKKQCFYAFWTEEERHFCEACDDALQIYHGVFILLNGKPFV